MEQNKPKLYQKPMNVKRLITEAYIKLLTEMPYSDITVTDIVKRADVARVSFYRIFGSIDKLLCEILDEFYQSVTEKVVPMFKLDRSGAWKTLLIETYRSIKEDKISPLKFSPENSSYLLTQIIRRFDVKHVAENLTIEQKYIPPTNIGIMFACAKIWSDSGYKETPEELADLVFKLIDHNISYL